MSTLSIVGVPFNGGQPKVGVERGPEELRKAGLVNVIEKAGWKVLLFFHLSLFYLFIYTLKE